MVEMAKVTCGRRTSGGASDGSTSEGSPGATAEST